MLEPQTIVLARLMNLIICIFARLDYYYYLVMKSFIQIIIIIIILGRQKTDKPMQGVVNTPSSGTTNLILLGALAIGQTECDLEESCMHGARHCSESCNCSLILSVKLSHKVSGNH